MSITEDGARTAHRVATTHPTPWGTIALAATSAGIAKVRFRARPDTAAHPLAVPDADDRDGPATHWLVQATREIDEYLAGHRTRFDVPIDLGRVEQPHRAVLETVRDVGYGRTCTYADLARAAGLTEDGPRRAGAAMARNPVLLLVPCHRVVGTNGGLTGYAGGLAVKKALLELERGQAALEIPVAAAPRPGR